MTPQEKLKDLDEGFPQRKAMPRAGFTVTGEQLDWLISRVKELESALENYRGISGHDCSGSTTKWSTADIVLDKDE